MESKHSIVVSRTFDVIPKINQFPIKSVFIKTKYDDYTSKELTYVSISINFNTHFLRALITAIVFLVGLSMFCSKWLWGTDSPIEVIPLDIAGPHEEVMTSIMLMSRSKGKYISYTNILRLIIMYNPRITQKVSSQNGAHKIIKSANN